MSNNAINLYNNDIGGVHHCTQIPSVATQPSKMITLGNELSRYGELGAEALERLSCISFKNIELKKNQKLYFPCHEKTEIFMVKKGWVSLCHPVKNRGHELCNVYMPGDIVGIRESFFNSHDIAILGFQDCQLEQISTDELHALCKHYEDVEKAVFSYVVVNDDISIERLRSCTHHKAEVRVAHFLLEIYTRYVFKSIIESPVFSFPITQEVVGELLGITSVHVSRCMTELEQKKLIRKSRNVIRLLEPDVLAEYANFDQKIIYGHVKHK